MILLRLSKDRAGVVAALAGIGLEASGAQLEELDATYLFGAGTADAKHDARLVAR